MVEGEPVKRDTVDPALLHQLEMAIDDAILRIPTTALRNALTVVSILIRDAIERGYLVSQVELEEECLADPVGSASLLRRTEEFMERYEDEED